MDTKKVLIFAGLSVVVLIAGYFIFFPAIKPDPDKPDPDKPDPYLDEYIPEVFPLAKGMYGETIRKIRAFFGLTPSSVFDAELETLLYKKYGIKVISQATYNHYNVVWINV